LCASWSKTTSTFADAELVARQPAGIFLNDQNTIFIVDREHGRILMWSNESPIPTKNISGNLTNSWSLFITPDGADKWVSNATYSALVMKVNRLCTDFFVDINHSCTVH
jgi:hypothetical protein